MRPETIQTKLQVGTPGDEYEREADLVADQVMRAELPNPSFDKRCDEDHRDVIVHRLMAAHVWVNKTIEALQRLLRNLDAPSSNIQINLIRHFHFEEVETEQRFRTLQRILTGFQEIQDGFAHPPFQCETSCDEHDEIDERTHRKRHAGAYVPLCRLFRIAGDIHLCPFWFDVREERAIADIIHEMAHKFAWKNDNAYERYRIGHGPAYAVLPPRDAVDNADSYAAFARDVSAGN